MGTSLAAGDCVDLVDDDRVDPPQRLTSLARQQEEQRLRRRDEDVRWPARERAPLVSRGVTRAHADLHVADGLAEAGRGGFGAPGGGGEGGAGGGGPRPSGGGGGGPGPGGGGGGGGGGWAA